MRFFKYHSVIFVSVVDSFGKLESGILLGKFRWLGTYDECVGSSAEKTNKYEGFNGLYCRASIKHPALVSCMMSIATQRRFSIQIVKTWMSYNSINVDESSYTMSN